MTYLKKQTKINQIYSTTPLSKYKLSKTLQT